MANALTLRFGSDVDSAKAGIASLAASIASNMATISGTALTAGRGVAAFGQSTISVFQSIRTGAQLLPTAVVGVAAAFAAFEIAKSAINGVKAELAALLEVADKSAARGISAEMFQTFTYGAKGAEDQVKLLEQALLNANQATKDILKPDWTVWDQGLTKVTAVEEAMRGLRELFDTSQKYTGLDLFRGAQNQDQRIQAVLTAMRELNAIGQRVAAIDLGEKMFGKEFADQVRLGKETIDQIVSRLETRPATILSNETVSRAKELDERLNDAWRTIAERMKPSWDDLGDAALRIKGIWTSIIEAVANYTVAANQARPFQSTTRTDGENSPDPNNAAFGNPAILNQGRRRRGQLPQLSGGDAPSEAAALDAMSKGFDYTGYSAPKPDSIPLPSRRPLDAPKPPLVTKEGLDQIETLINRMERQNAELEVEGRFIGQNNVEREKGVAIARAEAAARAAGRDLTSDEISKINGLAEAHFNLQKRIMDVEQAQRQAAEASRYFGDLAANSLADMILEGKSANEIFQNLSKTLARAALQGIFTGQGPLAGLLGTAPAASAGSNAVGGIAGLFTGLFRAGGGDVKAGQAVTVGELGREVFVPDQDGKVYPIGQARGGPPIIFNTTLDARGADPAAAVRMERSLQALAARQQTMAKQLQSTSRYQTTGVY